MRRRIFGFTLIELMIVVAIIGILAAIAIPKFAALIRKSNEGSTKGNLGILRKAIGIYYADMEGSYPADPTALTVNSKYMSTIPKAKIPPYHGDKSAIELGSEAIGLSDPGGWIFDSASVDSEYGNIFVNCTHTDSKGSTWGDY